MYGETTFLSKKSKQSGTMKNVLKIGNWNNVKYKTLFLFDVKINIAWPSHSRNSCSIFGLNILIASFHWVCEFSSTIIGTHSWTTSPYSDGSQKTCFSVECPLWTSSNSSQGNFIANVGCQTGNLVSIMFTSWEICDRFWQHAPVILLDFYLLKPIIFSQEIKGISERRLKPRFYLYIGDS